MKAAVLLLGLAAPLQAQLTLPQAVENSLKNYPSVRVSQEQINAASAAIQLARAAYLPKIDALAQANRATRNNVFGLLLPQSVIPSMSGPVIGSNNFGSVWGSAIGGLVTWEPFDFGLRAANVTTASAARAQSEAAVKRTQFEVAVATVDAYLTLVASQETVRAAQAGVDRADAVLKTITAQVGAQLRPGADQSRSEAELAAARTQLIQAQQAVLVSVATLAQFTGDDPAKISVTAGSLVQLPPEQAVRPERRRESDPGGAERRRRTSAGAVTRAGAIVFPPVLFTRIRLCARHWRRNQWRPAGRPQRPGSELSKLCDRLHGDVPDPRPARATRERGRAKRQYSLASRAIRADRHRSSRAVESRGRDIERRSARGRQYSGAGFLRARRRSAGDRAIRRGTGEYRRAG